jgi:UDPglucose--hexose-1-phosphate uridylyltransferase
MKQAAVTLADGRELIYFGDSAAWAAGYPDRRPLPAAGTSSQLRYDPLLGEWVIFASHRQDRTHRPAAGDCPLCPSAPGHLTEIPAPSYEVAVFENRFPALSAGPGPAGGPILAAGAPPAGGPASGEEGTAAGGRVQPGPDGLLAERPGIGRCEVISFSPDHDVSFAGLAPGQVATIMGAWARRSVALAALPGVEQVYCFENRGPEIGATLPHPHGQIYAYPFVTPRTARMLAMSRAYRQDTGRNLFDDLVAAQRADGSRIVTTGQHWTAFVPYAAHWPYEVHLYPRRRVPDLAALTTPEQDEFGAIYLDLLGRFDRLFGAPAPYISGWHQAPVLTGRAEFALHLELFTVRRAPGKLKYLAGSESGMGAFTNDIAPEAAAAALRQLG